MDLTGKCVLITGAAHGLGREVTRLLAAESCSLILVDRDAPNSDSIPNTRSFLCDLSNLNQRKKLIEDIKLGEKVDILINCAGVGSHSSLAQMTVDEVERVMQVNTLAPLELTAALSPLELVVNIGSVAGEMNLPSIGLYSASKSAVHAFTRSVSLEGTRTLLVILGPLRGTEFVSSIAHPRTNQPKWYRNLDLDVNIAAREIIRAMKKGRRQLVLPWWYGAVFVVSGLFTPLKYLAGSFGKK